MDYNIKKLIKHALQVARLKADGFVLDDNGDVILLSKSDIETTKKFHMEAIEECAMQELRRSTKGLEEKIYKENP